MDVWLTKDDQLAVLSGHENGEFPTQDDFGVTRKGKRIFDMTLEELRTHHRRSETFAQSLGQLQIVDESLIDIPSLDQVFDLLSGSNILLQIEAKTEPAYQERSAPRLQKFVEKLFDFLVLRPECSLRQPTAVLTSSDHQFL